MTGTTCRIAILTAWAALCVQWGSFTHAAKRPAARKTLVGHWTMDDRATGPEVRDASPNALHGTFSGATKGPSTRGRLGSALGFAGRSQVALDRHAAVLGTLTDFTLSMWIQYDGWGSRMLFSWSDGTMNRRIQAEVHGGKLHFGWQDGGGFTGFATKPLRWARGRWYHVVFINDRAKGKRILRSNDGASARHANTLGPAGLSKPVRRVQIGALNSEYGYHGRIDDVRLYNTALSDRDVRALYGGAPPEPKRPALVEDWLFQAEGGDLHERAMKEIAWTRALAGRLQERHDAPSVDEELATLAALERQARAADASRDPNTAEKFYISVRRVKRRILFKHPEVDFDEVVFVDIPYTRGNQWQHESRYRSIMCASHGGELLALKGLSPDGKLRKLAPVEGKAALFRPDVSYDGDRVLFCMKPEADKGYHLYEIGVDGQGLRQITSGGYSDLDPVYLPDGNIVFLTSRSNVYAGCGPWAPQHTMARCDPNGKNIYLLSVASEPEYSPSVLADGRVIYTRWEYNDKSLNRIQSLWAMNPDGTASSAYWGNQSSYPDHLGEARSIPGTPLVMFNGIGHHDVYRGCIGIVDTSQGLNFPHGVKKVTPDVPWPEVNDGPVPTPPVASDYHASGRFGGYKSPYPLSGELFLVSARPGNPKLSSQRDHGRGLFKLYLMDIHGNRELIYEGHDNILYAQPVRPRRRPPVIPDIRDWPGREADGKAISPGSFYSADVNEGLPEKVRGKGKYLRVIECVQRTYTTGCVDAGGSPFGSGRNIALDGPRFKGGNPQRKVIDKEWGDGAVLAGPAIAISSNTRLKRVLGTVPIAEDGSFYFTAPPGKAVYFQLLDENHLVLQSMRSWVNLMPGERRGCVGCHEGQTNTPTAGKTVPFASRRPDSITPPSWGVRTLSYLKDIQPIFDRNCGKCHQGKGKARKKLDLTLRPDKQNRWGGIFPEPYITLTCGSNKVNNACTLRVEKLTIAGNFFIWLSPYTTIPPMTRWSYKSRLINMHLHGKHNDVKLTDQEMRKLIVWVDTNCHYRSLADVLSISDPDPDWYGHWPYRPRLKSAPYVNPLYCQDEFPSPADRRPLRERIRKP